MILNYLGKYQNLFVNENLKDILEIVTQATKIDKFIFSVNPLDSIHKIPNLRKRIIKRYFEWNYIIDIIVGIIFLSDIGNTIRVDIG